MVIVNVNLLPNPNLRMGNASISVTDGVLVTLVKETNMEILY